MTHEPYLYPQPAEHVSGRSAEEGNGRAAAEAILGEPLGEKPTPLELAAQLTAALAEYDFDAPTAKFIHQCHAAARDLVAELGDTHPPLRKLPLAGQLLWRQLDVAVAALPGQPVETVFAHVDRFQYWLTRQYALVAPAPTFRPESAAVPTVGAGAEGSADGGADAKPVWDPELRELKYKGRLVKRFRVRAEYMELLIEAFAESGWPRRIDNPLPPPKGSTATQRLAEVVRGLNGPDSPIRFERDGTAEGVLWLNPTTL